MYYNDFCGSGVNTEKTIDSTFQSTYEANYGDGLPEFTVESVLEGDGKWTATIVAAVPASWHHISLQLAHPRECGEQRS